MHRPEYLKILSERMKGNTYAKGSSHPMSEETKKKLSIINTGKKGKPHTAESKAEMSKKMKGRKITWATKISEVKKGQPNGLMGKKFSEERRLAMRQTVQKGEKHWNWKGGVTKENKLIRRSLEFRLCREKAFKRDNYTCQDCGQHGGNLHPHHKLSFAHYPELRFDVNNIVTLCESCHKKTDNFGSKGIKKEQLIYAI